MYTSMADGLSSFSALKISLLGITLIYFGVHIKKYQSLATTTTHDLYTYNHVHVL